MRALRRLMVVQASTKRYPPVDVATRTRGAAVTNLSSLMVCPLDPVGSEVQRYETLDLPVNTFQTFTQRCDVIAGDVLVVDGVDYMVHAVSDWDGPSARPADHLLHLYVHRVAKPA